MDQVTRATDTQANCYSWGCPKCGGKASRVAFIEYDADGVPVRLRSCQTPNCDGAWASEERQIAADVFWQRAESPAVRERARARREIHVCRRCGGTYRGGSYSRHCAKSQRHNAALAPQDRDPVKRRAYQRKWQQRRRDQERAA
jgi:hypothetical protein